MLISCVWHLEDMCQRKWKDLNNELVSSGFLHRLMDRIHNNTYPAISYYLHRVLRVYPDRNGHRQNRSEARLGWTHSEIPEQCPRRHFPLINKMANDVIPPKNGATSLQQSSSYLQNLCVSASLPFYRQLALICCDLCSTHSPYSHYVLTLYVSVCDC